MRKLLLLLAVATVLGLGTARAQTIDPAVGNGWISGDNNRGSGWDLGSSFTDFAGGSGSYTWDCINDTGYTIYGLEFDINGNFFYDWFSSPVLNGGECWFTVSGGEWSYCNVECLRTPTPEPTSTSLLLLGTGLVGLAGALRRRRS